MKEKNLNTKKRGKDINGETRNDGDSAGRSHTAWDSDADWTAGRWNETEMNNGTRRNRDQLGQ